MKQLTQFLLLLPFLVTAQLSQEFKKHWFDGKAEISSYELTQSRYGEQRSGKAVLIYVTEDFLVKEQVKANSKSDKSILVLKSNRTKSFLTGIYPYSVMSSSFNSLSKKHSMLKSSASIQEWCGQSYLQINQKEEKLNILSHSYFEGEADQIIEIDDTFSEDAIWNIIRLNPNNLPTGKFLTLPSLELLRLNHIPIEKQVAEGELTDNSYSYEIKSIGRKLTIFFSSEFPYTVEGWEEKYEGKGEKYHSKAKRIHTERRAYWQENKALNTVLRKPFKLD